MARRRWSVRCTARRTDGSPCKGWAITGGRVCTAHGGAAPTTQWAAAGRVWIDDLHRAADAEQAAFRWRTAVWYARRCQAAADTAGDVDPEELARRPALLGAIEAEAGIIPPPRPELHRDRRFRARRPGFGADLPRLPANSRIPSRAHHVPHCPHWPQPGTQMCSMSTSRLFAEIDSMLAAARKADR